MGISLILASIFVVLALGLGVVVGRRRGVLMGFAMSLAVLATGVVIYIGLVASTYSM